MEESMGAELESNVMMLLRRELAETEAEVYRNTRLLVASRERLERLSAQLHLTQQQIDLFKHETQSAAERIKDATWHFTKEACSELSHLSEPSASLLDLAEKFMLLLDQQDRSWKTFKAILKNFGPLKALMNSISPDHLSEEQLSALLPIWKNQQILQAKLAKIARGAVIIAEWISYCVEYKLKKETLNSALKRLPELEKKIRTVMAAIANQTASVSSSESRVSEIRQKMTKAEESAAQFLDLSVSSLRSTAAAKVKVEDPTPRPKTQSPRFQQEFPNFLSEELYRETLAERQEQLFEVDFGESQSVLGCCRSRFFCM